MGDVQCMAISLKQSLPLSVTQLLTGDAWKGGALIQLEDTTSTPRAEALVLNYSWVVPFVKKFNDRVPSAFFVTDVFLFLDRIWFGKLLQPLNAGETKQSLAAEESKKIKSLIGALRALWRSSSLVCKFIRGGWGWVILNGWLVSRFRGYLVRWLG